MRDVGSWNQYQCTKGLSINAPACSSGATSFRGMQTGSRLSAGSSSVDLDVDKVDLATRMKAARTPGPAPG